MVLVGLGWILFGFFGYLRFMVGRGAPDSFIDQFLGPRAAIGETLLTAAEVLNTYPATRLHRVLRDYGEERFARQIADAVVRERSRAPLTSTACCTAPTSSTTSCVAASPVVSGIWSTFEGRKPLFSTVSS